MAAKQRMTAGRQGPVLVSETSAAQRMTATVLIAETSPSTMLKRRHPKVY